jgi:hypothetical protein
MKKILSALVLTGFTLYALPQSSKNSVASTNSEVAVPQLASNYSAADVISQKAVNNFEKTFKNVSEVKWYEMPDGYRANCIMNGVRCRLDYDKRGNWLHTIKYIDEKKLPIDVRRLVASSYLDYSITSIEQIELPHHQLVFVIHLQGEKNWINIRVSDSEISELQTINKS